MKNTLLQQLKAEIAEEFRRDILDELKQDFIDELKDAVRSELYDELCWADLEHYQLETIQQFYDDEYPEIAKKISNQMMKLTEYGEILCERERQALIDRFNGRIQEIEHKLTKNLAERIERLVNIELTEKIRSTIMDELLKDFRNDPCSAQTVSTESVAEPVDNASTPRVQIEPTHER